MSPAAAAAVLRARQQMTNSANVINSLTASPHMNCISNAIHFKMQANSSRWRPTLTQNESGGDCGSGSPSHSCIRLRYYVLYTYKHIYIVMGLTEQKRKKSLCHSCGTQKSNRKKVHTHTRILCAALGWWICVYACVCVSDSWSGQVLR